MTDADPAPGRSSGVALPQETADVLHPIETVGFGSRRPTSRKRVGGKAAALGDLRRAGFPVPPAWVLDARAFDRFVEAVLPRGHDLPTLIKLAGTQAGVDRAARARDRILAAPLPDSLRRALSALWDAVKDEAPWGLAVRSSATCEDLDQTSLAGLAESVLGVRGPEALEDAVRRVWASAVLPRAIAYLVRAEVRHVSMAVVLQVMARAQAAGVLFTAPPPGLAGDHWQEGEMLVTATLGLGAPVVEGARQADAYRLARGGAVVATIPARKDRALVVGASGLEEREVAEEERAAPALSTEALRQLAAVAERLEARGPGPYDVEFAVEGTAGGGLSVVLLQARPVTGGGFPEGGDAETVWSRANVGEALPGAATPLTWSIARTFSDKGFREAFGALGCSVPRKAALVGNVQGRFYLNLSAFLRIAAQVPGLTPHALLGVSGGANAAAIALLERQVADVSHRGFLARAPFTGPRLMAQYARLAREVGVFEESAGRAHRDLLAMDLRLLPDDGLATTLRSAAALLDRTGALMLACASASLASHLALVKLLERVAAKRASARDAGELDRALARAEDAERIAHTLTGGVRELVSAEPGIALARTAEIVRADAALTRRLAEGALPACASDLPRGAARDAIERFLEAYGDRAVREAELATPRWREDARPLFAMLASALRAPPGDPDRALARARALSDGELARLETRLGPVRLAAVRSLVGATQHFTRLRERMRTWVTRILGMLRTIALDADRRLRRIEPALPEGSVFFCTYAELLAALSSGRAEVGHVVRLRRAEHLRDVARPDPPAIFIGRPPPITLPPVAGARLVGLPASSGVVEGPARVLPPGARGLDDVAPGEILVSRTTDVGLSPLFLVAAAVVTELGGPLSHAAVVAREYGVPAVVNVTGATAAIRTGDRLRVDGDRGIVERLDDTGPLAAERAASEGARTSPPAAGSSALGSTP